MTPLGASRSLPSSSPLLRCPTWGSLEAWRPGSDIYYDTRNLMIIFLVTLEWSGGSIATDEASYFRVIALLKLLLIDSML